MWQQLYASFWLSPVGFALANVVLLVALARGRTATRPLLAGFAVVLLLDTTLINDSSPLPAAVWQRLAVLFVIAGDLRVWWLLERIAAAPRRFSDGLARALPLTLVLPALQALALVLWPAAFASAHVLYLSYELAFLLLLLVYAVVRLAPVLRTADPPLRRWAAAIGGFAAVQYALWAAADVVILSGQDAGFALRLIPNVLYYALFLPFVWLTTPPTLAPRPVVS